jgi:hypothetical protein
MKYTRVHRLFRLITQIQGSTHLNARRLAELCETSERNIYRDLKMLEGAGVPVSFDLESGGYAISRNFFLRPVDLTLEEGMAMLMLADRVGAREQIPHAAHAGKAAEKVRAVLPRQINEMINEVMPRVFVSLAQSSNEPTADVYGSMRDAIIHRRALECKYESSSPKKSGDAEVFRFDPYALYFGQRAWYVVGRGEARLEQAGHGVGGAGPGAGDDDAQLPGGTGVPVGRVSGGLLVPHPDRRDGTAARDRVVDRQVVDAHDAEDVADAERLEGGGNRLPSRHLQWTLLISSFIENSDSPGTSK